MSEPVPTCEHGVYGDGCPECLRSRIAELEAENEGLLREVSLAKHLQFSAESQLQAERSDSYGKIESLRSQLEEARAAMRRALDELGVPGDGYPAPIANAVEILRGALSPQQEGER